MSQDLFLKLAEDLWIGVYERGFIEIEDVEHYQRWLESLIAVGHQFFQPEGDNTALNVSNKDKVLNFSVGKSTLGKVPSGGSLPDNCQNLLSKTFWTSDVHDGCRTDTPSVLSYLGQKTILAGRKGGQTFYPEVFQQPGITINRNVNEFLKTTYCCQHYSPTQQQIQDNYEFFKKDPLIDQVDGFFCQFPAPMCQLWFPFRKSILYTPVHRLSLIHI